MPDPADLRSTIERYWASFSAKDRDGLLACFADGAWIEDPIGTPRRNGKDSIGEFFDQSQSMADSVALVPGDVVNICGNEAAFVMQAQPTIGGTTYAIDIIDVMTFDDDARITTMKAYWNPAEMRPL
jgi:steroid delta-isomerase